MKLFHAVALALVIGATAAGAAVAAPGATTTQYPGYVVISYPAHTHGYSFITDTLSGAGRSDDAAKPGYRFITDTLSPGGGSVAVGVPGTGFNWADAAIGAAGGIGVLFVLTGALLVVLRQRGRLAV